eukprot:5329338-Prymnesium_polylepis.1
MACVSLVWYASSLIWQGRRDGQRRPIVHAAALEAVAGGGAAAGAAGEGARVIRPADATLGTGSEPWPGMSERGGNTGGHQRRGRAQG